jgi:hypothetical protein
MYEKGFLKSFPISCLKEGNRLVVSDGQHRLAAAELLGIPVHYVIEETAVDPASIPSQKKWDTKDYINRHAASGNEAYVYMKDFAEHFGITENTAYKMLTDDVSNNRRNEFITGKATIRAKQEAIIAANCARNCKNNNKNLLINPMALTVYKLKLLDIDLSDAAMRIETNADQMNRFNSVEMGMFEVEKAYNFRLPYNKRVPLAMRYKEKALQIKKTFGRHS